MNTIPKEWIYSANNWMKRAKLYGDDMKSSQTACLLDAKACLDKAIKAVGVDIYGISAADKFKNPKE